MKGAAAALMLLALLPACGGDRVEGADLERCEGLSDLFEAVGCYADLAERWDEPGICDRAAHEGVRWQCYALFAERTSNPRVCDTIPGRTVEHVALRDACTSDVAAKTGDHRLCAKIETPGLRDGCYFKIARESADPEPCRWIAEPGLKEVCAARAEAAGGAPGQEGRQP